ncbi:alpha/beta hydrolase [Gemmatimonas sp.]|jgi:esterase/lipase superfamily enzyme|uniref:alpha/beta hydrolase n=1 Tax=Gemmatimonas sp. TaxID=1962908 RepID=UPI0022C09BD3|nr:alpha/beta hydrolase [Gemmatimonas sp.]MCA2986818.1 alpha/beta hydrolase [Gemmatimonas sp.]MCA2994551.1 alpha/beta hydrolase [Gemmatimonas sp.]MCE2952676.1 alpha/beta hydrolase [Gemmatimonas sp.]MCZ8010895.1 alpha/beta hydrolase [Gemmatimonas sp.]MCZ8266285.1 alpha/beta hydrolase [Gemmatimonas sp.]
MRLASLRSGWLVALALLLPACRSLSRATPHVSGLADTVFYVSARARIEGRDTRARAASLEYGLAVMQRHQGTPDDRGLGRDIMDSVLLDSVRFVQLLRARVQRQRAPLDLAVLYVHGMGTSLHEAWQYAAAASVQSGTPVPWIVFCWPASGSGASRPQPQAFFTAGYHRDAAMADSARAAFAQTLQVVRAAVPNAQLVLASHSLGGQLVGRALHHDTTLRADLERAPLRALAFAIPDVNAQAFNDTLAPALRYTATRRVVYVTRNDRAMMVARRINGTPRAGLRSAGNWRAADSALVETVDVTNAATTEGWFQSHFGSHHAIKRKTGLLVDLVAIVGGQRDATCRSRVGFGEPDADGIWRLQHVVPTTSDLLACPAMHHGAAR